ncbi:MAG TPA: O-antigen translocase [Candidatus Acidoferrum sp.]|nr:O-antigen translocase [Candidatus Acidoferrum sp.]
MSTQIQSAELSTAGKKTYGQILKSSALIGGSSAVNIGLSMVRTKVMALLLEPAGIGLFGLYGSIFDLVRAIGGMGINTSGVRQIAEAVGSGDSQRIARTVTTLRRVAFILGALGALLLVIFCKPVSHLSFGSTQRAGSVALLALAVFFADVSAGQGAVVQGMRRIGDLARMSVLGAFYGTVFSILIVYFYGERGIVPSLVCVAAMGILTSWWYSRKVKVERVSMTFADISGEVSALLQLGFVFMAVNLMTLAVAYLVRIIVLRQIGPEAAGFYQAAWALGGLYVGFILQAMGTDFYPRLTAVANDNAECNRLVNEQAEVGLLIAGPGVLGTLTFAPLVIQIFYSAKFGPAVEILRWICLGMILRVASWPMGFILGAKGARQTIFWSEFAASAIQIGLAWFCVLGFGLKGAGIAFFASYLLYGGLIYAIVRSVSGFRWTAANRRLGLLFVPLVALVFVSWYCLPPLIAAMLGAAITLVCGIYSARMLSQMIPWERIPRGVQKVLLLLRLVPRERQH